jgi:alpha-galactosidase
LVAGTQPHKIISCSDGSIKLEIDIDPIGVARMTRLAAAPWPAVGDASAARFPRPAAEGGLPLVDVVLAGEGRAWSGSRYCESVAGQRMRYLGHERSRLAEAGPAGTAGSWFQLRVDLADPVTGLKAEVFYRILEGCGAFRSWVHLSNQGTAPVTVESVTSFLCGGLAGGIGPDDLSELDVLWSENDWLAEGRWQRRALRDALPDLNRRAHGGDPRGRFGITSVGTWSSGGYLPMGAIINRRTGRTWVWQIEHNGAWHWQAGECTRRQGGRETTDAVGHQTEPGAASGAYVAVLGPTDSEHHWHVTLAPGETFTTVPAAVAVSAEGLDDALGRLTGYRRAIRRPHSDRLRLPVIFNDYMNTLMGDPTTDRLLPLITAAASVGAECFCIDAGWYAEPGESWWDTVGAWKPSGTRFSGGIAEVLEHIRAAGMTPGLWLEPEVVGVRSAVAGQLPAEAFFIRGGQRVVENGRYHLDLRHPAAVKHLDEVVDYLVGDLGVGYLKLDYNVNGGPGTDVGGLSAGAGLLAHNRAHLEWLDAVLDRHPGLVIENCASGGMRMDYALLSRLQLQSTSDQQDFLRYPPITAAVPAAVTPEQAATWAYPQPGFSDQEIIFTLCGALLGRIHLSGHIDRMSETQRRLVADAVDVYKQIRAELPGALPFWPLGLPEWTDSWLALGMRTPGAAYILVWHRGRVVGTGAAIGEPTGLSADDRAEFALPVACLHDRPAVPEVLYPRTGQPPVSWDPRRGELSVTLRTTPAACLVRLGTGVSVLCDRSRSAA